MDDRCLHCRLRKVCRPRGLCMRCSVQPAVREQYPSLALMGRPRVTGDVICQHCTKSKVNRPHGLCWSCYYTPGVKEMYPSTSPYARRGVGNFAGAAPMAVYPTAAAPGSEDKILVMIRRADDGRAVCHPLDRRQDEPADQYRRRLAGRPCEEDLASSLTTRCAA